MVKLLIEELREKYAILDEAIRQLRKISKDEARK